MSLSLGLAWTEGDQRQASRDLAEVVMNAGRKRRILSEALNQHHSRQRWCTVFAAIAGFTAACAGFVMWLDLGSWTYLLPAAIVFGCGGGAAACLSLLLDRIDRPGVVAADAARCDLIVRQLKALGEQDFGSGLGDRLLTAIETELQLIGARQRRLDGAEFIAGRRHQRFAVPDTSVTLALRNGERRPAMIRDLSRSGVALKTDLSLAPGTVVTIGSTPARAVRRTEDGIAFEFLKPFPRDGFSLDIVL